MAKGDQGPKNNPLKIDARETDYRSHALWKHIGHRLRLRRTQLGYAADAVAKKLGVSPQIYEQYEAGHLQTPAMLLSDIAQLFHLPVTWFFQDLASDDPAEITGAEEE